MQLNDLLANEKKLIDNGVTPPFILVTNAQNLETLKAATKTVLSSTLGQSVTPPKLSEDQQQSVQGKEYQGKVSNTHIFV